MEKLELPTKYHYKISRKPQKTLVCDHFWAPLPIFCPFCPSASKFSQRLMKGCQQNWLQTHRRTDVRTNMNSCNFPFGGFKKKSFSHKNFHTGSFHANTDDNIFQRTSSPHSFGQFGPLHCKLCTPIFFQQIWICQLLAFSLPNIMQKKRGLQRKSQE